MITEIRRRTTPAGIEVIRTTEPVDEADAPTSSESAPRQRPGLLLSSPYERPGRRRHGDLGNTDPPGESGTGGRAITIRALTERCEVDSCGVGTVPGRRNRLLQAVLAGGRRARRRCRSSPWNASRSPR